MDAGKGIGRIGQSRILALGTVLAAGLTSMVAPVGAVEAVPTAPVTAGETATRTAKDLTCLGRPVTIVAVDRFARGTNGDDVILLTEPGQVVARAGDDLVCGSAGADTVFAGTGDDRVIGDSGRDRLLGQGGIDEVRGDKGRDTVKGGRGVDDLFGGPAGDWLWGGRASAVMSGGAGVDHYWAAGAADSFKNGSWGVLINRRDTDFDCLNYNFRDWETEGAMRFILAPNERYQDGRHGGYQKHADFDLSCKFNTGTWLENFAVAVNNPRRGMPEVTLKAGYPETKTLSPGESFTRSTLSITLYAERQRNTPNKNALVLFYASNAR